MEIKTEQNSSSNKSLKVIIIILLLLLIGSLGYIYKLSNDHTTEVTKITSEKDQLDADLKDAIAKYDEAIAENTSLSGELAEERDKLIALQDQLKKSQGDVASLRKYRDSYNSLKKQMDSLLAENKQLKAENEKLNVQIDSTMTELNSSKDIVNQLSEQTEILSSKVKEASKLVITNVQSHAFKKGGLLGGSNLKDTDKASKADVLNISFAIAGNSLAEKGEKKYYVQVIDSKNNVLGDNETVLFGEKYLSYSFIKEIDFQGKSVTIKHDIPVKNLEKGLFTVNVFEEANLVGSSSFDLK
nr:hypothetical protein [uncultured Flavobacterium sp.]